MKRLILQAFCLIFVLGVFTIMTDAEQIFDDVDFPKIIYQCPNTQYAPDYDLIDQSGFNMILAQFESPCNVLKTQFNQAAIPIMFKGWNPNIMPDIDKYVRSKVIRRNIVEDREYIIGSDQMYPGWSPRIRVQNDQLELNPVHYILNGIPTVDTLPCPAEIIGRQDADPNPLFDHDVIIYEHAAYAQNQIVFTTNDGQGYSRLYDHSTFTQGESAKPAIIRLKVKIIGDIPDDELPILTLKLFYIGRREGALYDEWILDAGQEYTLTLDDIINHCDIHNGLYNPHAGTPGYVEGDYNWACFNVLKTGNPEFFGEPVFVPVYITNDYVIQGGLYTFTNLKPNISVCSPASSEFPQGVEDVSYSVYIDSLEVWELYSDKFFSPDVSLPK